MVPAPWEDVICKCGVGANEDIICNLNTAPDLHPALDGDTIAERRIAFDKDPVANVAVLTNKRAGEDMGKSPDFGSQTDVSGFNDSSRMNKHIYEAKSYFFQ